MKNTFKRALCTLLSLNLIICCFCVTYIGAAQKGDVNGDGAITAADARLILRYAVSLEKFTDSQKKTADYNNDGSITAADARSVLRAAVGLLNDDATGYDILRSGKYYVKAMATDETGTKTPIEIACSGNKTYAKTTVDGVELGMFVDNKKLYMIWDNKKMYTQMDGWLLNMMGIDVSEFTDVASMSSASKPLSAADAKSRVVMNGKECDEYLFCTTNGRTVVYLDGTKLLRMDEFDLKGKLIMRTDYETVTSTIPAGKLSVPSGYKKEDAMEFCLKLYKEMTGSDLKA